MEPFDYGKALADMWAQGGKTFLEAQERALRVMREGTSAIAMPGATPSMLPDVALDAGELAKANQRVRGGRRR